MSSPVRAFSDLALSPLVIERGKGDTIWDSDGIPYIDFCGSWGPLILGHADERITSAIHDQIQLGSTFGAATEIELKLASKIISHMPSIEKIRFVSSGTEATMSALRLARGHTSRSLFVKFDGNYHGHADPFLVSAGSALIKKKTSPGVPAETLIHSVSLPYNDIETTRTFLKEHRVAAVIIEPIAGNMGLIPATQEFLTLIREETRRQGALLIFDEVISGFRVGLGGAQALSGITPDLICLGKIIGGGLPAAAFGGRADVMDHLAPHGPVFQAGTLSGCPAAMRAGVETLTLLEQEGVYETLEKKTRILTDPIQAWINAHEASLCLHQIGSSFTLFFGLKEARTRTDVASLDLTQFNHFYNYLFERGIYFPPSPYETAFVSLSHTKKHLEMTRDSILEYFESYMR